MGKKRFLKELGLSLEVVEPREARSEMTGGDSETEERKPHPPTEENSDAPEAELEAPQPIEESAEHLTEQPPAKEPVTKPGERHAEMEKGQATPVPIGESVADEAMPDSDLFLGKEAAGELEPGRATMAAATILPLSLLDTKRAWVWIVLVCVAIAGYLLTRWYFGRGESTSPPKQEPQIVEEFMRDF